MGEENNGVTHEIFASVGGEWHRIEPLDATSLAVSITVPSYVVPLMQEVAIHGTLRVPKHFRCRSRKRLKKLLMANKIGRNEAEILAWAVQVSGVSYADAWWTFWPQMILR